MSYTIVKRGEGYESSMNVSIIMESSSDVASLPTDVAPGSIAYTADLGTMAIFGLDGSWHTI